MTRVSELVPLLSVLTGVKDPQLKHVHVRSLRPEDRNRGRSGPERKNGVREKVENLPRGD